MGIVGLKQPYNPDFAILDIENTQSRSGLFVTDNSFAKIEYLKATQDYDDITDDDFNQVLKDMQKSSIINVCSQVFSDSDYVDRNLIYKYAGNKTETDTLPSGFIGYKICVSDEKNVAFKITRVLLDFDSNEEITLMLFNTAKKEPIQTQVITIDSDHKEVVLNWVVDNSETTYKGDYYIGYLSADLDLKPFKRDYENSNIANNITYLDIEKVKVSNHNTNVLFDLTKVEQLEECSGLNLDITVYEDYTDLIVQNEFVFARAIYLDFIINFLHSYLTSLRSNRNERLSETVVSRALIEIEGTKGDDSPVVVKGLRPQFLREISQIKNELMKLKKGYFGEYIEVVTRT